MRADVELLVEAWKLAALPSPKAITLNIFGRNQMAERLQTSRLQASSNLTPGFIESRVTGNHKLLLVFVFFFPPDVKG